MGTGSLHYRNLGRVSAGRQRMTELEAPYPYAGGKRRAAPLIWPRFGSTVPNFVEPFFGSGAVLLARPGGAGKIETVNDIDGGIINFWRALQRDPEAVAEWAEWPVSELDLHARHDWLIQQLPELAERLRADPDYCDPKMAGWWVWGIALWIGTGWCRSTRKQRPELRSTGGVHRKSWRQRPQLASENGIHRKMSIGNDRGIHGVSVGSVRDWFEELRERTQGVRFLCGDWKRVLTPAVLGKGKNVGGRRPAAVLLDPPYEVSLRTKKIYANDAEGISTEVREWALEHGDDPDLRIALCGYEGEHAMPDSWEVVPWVGTRGHASEDNDNRFKERIWFSPHCLKPSRQLNLF